MVEQLGASKPEYSSGNPCDRLIAAQSFATQVILRIIDSVKCPVRQLVSGTNNSLKVILFRKSLILLAL
jgi:hypothetical protein